MNSIVCLKQVPDTNEVKINQETGTLIRDGVPSIINPDDKNALEEALRIKGEQGGAVTVITMGPEQAKAALREALAMGADRAILLSDRAFAGSDTWATATILAAALEKAGMADLIFCGRQAIDGDTAQVGPELAEFLNIPQITYVKELSVKKGAVRAVRYGESGDYVMEAPTPVLLTAIRELNEPRLPHVRNILRAWEQKEIEVWTMADLPLDGTQIGLKGSPTNVLRSFVPTREKQSEIILGNTAREKAALLLDRLSARKLI